MVLIYAQIWKRKKQTKLGFVRRRVIGRRCLESSTQTSRSSSCCATRRHCAVRCRQRAHPLPPPQCRVRKLRREKRSQPEQRSVVVVVIVTSLQNVLKEGSSQPPPVLTEHKQQLDALKKQVESLETKIGKNQWANSRQRNQQSSRQNKIKIKKKQQQEAPSPRRAESKWWKESCRRPS